MINYKNQELFLESSTQKSFVITFDDGDIITNTELESEQFTMVEAICSQPELTFGDCNATEVRFPIRNVYRKKVGTKFNIDIILNGNTEEPFRLCTNMKVQSDVPTADRTKREIVAYDTLYDLINSNVATWYNQELASGTKTLTQFIQDFATYFSVDLVPLNNEYPNRDMVIKKTINPQELSGKDVLRCVGEMLGAFPHINREGALTFVKLDTRVQGIYPSNTLYPSDELFPRKASGGFIKMAHYVPPLKYEDYLTANITGIVLKQSSDDNGTLAGTDGNNYIIEGNFLVFGKNADELRTIGNNILANVSTIRYRPFSVKCVGNPCIEVGDSLRLNTKNAQIETHLLQRTLSGIQALSDDYSALGEEKISNELNSVSSQYKQLSGKITSLQIDANGIEGRVEDIESGDATIIQQLSNSISLKVSKSGLVEDLDDEMSGIDITSNSIAIGTSGKFTVDSSNFKLDENSNVTIITDSTQQKGKFKQSSYNGQVNTEISAGLISCNAGGTTFFQVDMANSGKVSWGDISKNYLSSTEGKINGSTIITASNIGSYAISASNLDNFLGARGITSTSEGTAINPQTSDGWVHVGYSSSAVSIGSSSVTLRIKSKLAVWKKKSALADSDYVLVSEA